MWFLFLSILAPLTLAVDYPVCSESSFVQSILPRVLVKPATESTLIGYNDTMEELVALLIKPLENPKDYYGLLGSRRGLLLFGPPGTGKTFSMETLAARLEAMGMQMWKLQYADMWESAMVGEGQTKMRCFLDRAEEPNRAGKVVLLFDEGETLFKSRGGKDTDQYAQEVITVALNRINPSAKFRAIIITNLPQDVDFAIRRRMGNQFCYRLPNPEERYQMFCEKLRESRFPGPGWLIDQNFDVNDFKKQTHLFSGDDVQRLCERLVSKKAREATSPIREKSTAISNEDFQDALRFIRPVSTLEDLEQYSLYSEKYSNPCFTEYKTNSTRAKRVFLLKETSSGTSARYQNLEIENALQKREAFDVGSCQYAAGCVTHSNCETCSADSECVWCGTNCVAGTMFGPKDSKSCGLFEWSYRQCTMAGFWILTICASIILVLVLLLVCILCCCCRRKTATDADVRLLDNFNSK